MALTFDAVGVELDRARAALRSRVSRLHRPVDADGAILWVQDVFKVYQQGDVEAVVLRGADLRMEPGEFLAIVGRSGVGKTTLLNMIGGLDTPTAGRVVLQSIDIAKLDEATRAAFRRYYLGIVYQEGNLIPFLSAWENVALPLRLAGQSGAAARRRATTLLQRLGMGARLDHRPAQLSGGEVQRVAIAVGLALQPALLLADELTGELDSETTEAVMALLHTLNHEDGLTLVMVTHNERVAAQAGRIVRLVDGVLRPAKEER